MAKHPGSPERYRKHLPSDDIPNPRVLNAILRILRAFLWFVDRTPRTSVDSRKSGRDDVRTLLHDLPSIIAQQDDVESQQ